MLTVKQAPILFSAGIAYGFMVGICRGGAQFCLHGSSVGPSSGISVASHGDGNIVDRRRRLVSARQCHAALQRLSSMLIARASASADPG